MPAPDFKESLIPGVDKLPDEYLGYLISAVGNHENKAILCAAMLPGVTYSRSDLDTLMNSVQGDNPAWESRFNVPFQYCLHSLAPIGFVAKEIIDKDKRTVGFVKTPLGEELGEAISGHLLDYSFSHPEISLIQLFGRTGTSAESGARSPMNRIEVFGELLTRQQPIRVSDVLVHDPNGHPVASSHINSLAREGLITLHNRSNTDPIVVYGLADKPLKELRLRSFKSPLPSDIRDFLSAHLSQDKEVTSSQITDFLKSQSPSYREMDPLRLLVQVNQALRSFAKNGAIKKVGEFTNESRSVITLDNTQRRILEDCLDLIYGLQDLNETFLDAGKQKAQRILADPEAVKTLISKARVNSPFVNRKLKEERADLLKAVLNKNSQLTVAQIEAALMEQGDRLSRHSIRRALHEMEVTGEAKQEVIKKKTVWFLMDHA
jgi:DNA-binding transcriptional ArsR family regulator